jgi:hypothetical protein
VTASASASAPNAAAGIRGPAALVPDSSPARSTPIPANTNVAGMRSEKYFSVSEASAPARVAMLRLWISSTQTTLVRVSAHTPQAASMMSVMLARRVSGGPRNQANSARGRLRVRRWPRAGRCVGRSAGRPGGRAWPTVRAWSRGSASTSPPMESRTCTRSAKSSCHCPLTLVRRPPRMPCARLQRGDPLRRHAADLGLRCLRSARQRQRLWARYSGAGSTVSTAPRRRSRSGSAHPPPGPMPLAPPARLRTTDPALIELARPFLLATLCCPVRRSSPGATCWCR